MVCLRLEQAFPSIRGPSPNVYLLFSRLRQHFRPLMPDRRPRTH